MLNMGISYWCELVKCVEGHSWCSEDMILAMKTAVLTNTHTYIVFLLHYALCLCLYVHMIGRYVHGMSLRMGIIYFLIGFTVQWNLSIKDTFGP